MNFCFFKKKKEPTFLVEPKDTDAILNLIFHFHCVDHEKIFYAVDKLSQHIDKFNGYKIFTLSAPNDKFYNNDIFCYIVSKFKNYSNTIFIPVNNDLETRECNHFFNHALPLLILLADMPNKKSYTFYAHSKGCTHNEKDYAITCWVNTLYKYNLDLFESLIKPVLLSNTYKFVGCLKTDKNSSLGAKKHYAGTFFWFDSDIIRGEWHKFKKHVLALEMWPNTIVHENDMFSVWDREIGINDDLYRMDFWYNLVYHNIIDKPITSKKQ